jgi:hypothetical protein
MKIPGDLVSSHYHISLPTYAIKANGHWQGMWAGTGSTATLA